jgi:hypothetical protein
MSCSTARPSNSEPSEVKTVIFSLSDASFRNAYAGGTMDFRISNGEGTQDVTIRSVRVMRGGQ